MESVISLDDLEGMKQSICSLPVDLTEERVTPKGPRLWDRFMDALILQARENEEHRNSWMGVGIGYTYADVRHDVYLFGNHGTRSVGKVMLLKLTRHRGEMMVLGSLPVRLGGSTQFHCYATSDDYAAVLRMLARTLI